MKMEGFQKVILILKKNSVMVYSFAFTFICFLNFIIADGIMWKREEKEKDDKDLFNMLQCLNYSRVKFRKIGSLRTRDMVED